MAHNPEGMIQISSTTMRGLTESSVGRKVARLFSRAASHSQIENVYNYVLNQEKYHSKQTFQVIQ
jgi:hypothetical protein